MHRITLLSFALLALGACSSHVVDPGGDAATGRDGDSASPGDGGLDATTEDVVDRDLAAVETPGDDVIPHEYRTSIGPIAIMPGQEATWCVLRRLENTTPQYLRRIRAILGANSHHLIFYRSNATTERTTPFVCRGFSGVMDLANFDSPLLIAQNRDSVLEMPPGVGMNLGAAQMVRIEFHVVNATAAPVMASAEVVLDTVERSGFVIPADILFWGNVGINLPPHARTSLHFFHKPWSGTRIFGLTSHTHHLGTLATISLATNSTTNSAMSTDIRELHRSLSWSEPPLTIFDPPLRMETADQGLHLVCNYNNTSDQTVQFGESVDDEMCFMWSYYYPAPRGTQACVEGVGGGGGAMCFPP